MVTTRMMDIFKPATSSTTDSIAVVALKRLGDLQVQIERNEERIQTLELESEEYREQFERVNIVTAMLRSSVHRLGKQQAILLKHVKVIAFLCNLCLRGIGHHNTKSKAGTKLRLLGSLVLAAVIQRVLFLPAISRVILPGQRVQTVANIVSLAGLCWLIHRNFLF